MSPREISVDKAFYSITAVCESCGARAGGSNVICECGALLVTGLETGAVVGGRYKYIQTIGNGGMGLIVKAYDKQENCEVAVKLLLRNNNNAEVMRFMQECRATSALKHESIIEVKDFGVTDDGFPFMAMEYLDGEDLDAAISRKGSLEIDEALSIFKPVCQALAFAHSKGVIHRDIKPSNIMLVTDSDGARKVKLVDFGIAKVVYPDGTSAQTNLTQTGQIVGSPMYMSPEQSLGKKFDQRTDIYSAGCVLYHMLTGSPPIHGASALETLFKHVNEVPLGISEASIGKRFPPYLERLVAKTIEKDPEKRCQSFDELLAELDRSDATPEPIDGAETVSGATAGRRAITACLLSVAALAGVASCFWIYNALTAPLKPPEIKLIENSEPLPNDKDVAFFTGGGARAFIDHVTRTKSHQINLAEPIFNDLSVSYLVQQIQLNHSTIDEINLNRSRVTNAGLKTLAGSGLPIKALSIQGLNINGDALKSVGKITTLEKLDMSHNFDIPASALNNLCNLKRLDRFYMNDMHFKTSRAGDFAFLDNLKFIEQFCLEENPNLPTGVAAHIQSLSVLKVLRCEASGLTDKSLEYLGNISSLEELNAYDPGFTDKGARFLVGLTAMNRLEYGGPNITSKSFPALAKLQHLHALRLVACPKISQQDADALQKLMPGCRVQLVGRKKRLESRGPLPKNSPIVLPDGEEDAE